MIALPTPAAAGSTPVSLASLLLGASPAAEPGCTMRHLRCQTLAPALAVALLIAAWSAWAPLSGAVVASGQVQAALGRKVVQHLEGGIVRELLVRPGQPVQRGEALLVVGDLRSDATLAIVRSQMQAEALRAARCRAEIALAPRWHTPDELAAPAQMLAREKQLFDTRRESLDQQLAAMQSQGREAQARIAALHAQRQATDRSTALAREELGLNAELVQSGFVQKSRLLAMERGVAETLVRGEAARSQIAEAQMQLGAIAGTMAQTRAIYRQRATDELKDAEARLRELEDRLRPTQDQADRQTVRSPVDGVVMSLRVSAPGTAVGPREPLLEIAPSDERLVVELRIDPQDIDHVKVGDAAEVRLAAFNPRSTPLLQAVVTAVSPDAASEAPGQPPGYAAQVEVRQDALASHPQLRLQAGMPAEVFITTPPRSLLRYLLEPVGLFAQRALREP